MAVALPAMESTQSARAEFELQCNLSKLRLFQVDDSLSHCQIEVTDLRDKHVRNDQRRKDLLVKEENRALRREAKKERMRMRHYSATKIQAFVRSFFARRFILPSVLEAKATEELKKSRVALAETMLGLHQNIHDLAFLELDQKQAATHIQAWWRGVLAKRVVAIVRIRFHLKLVHMQMAKSATRISSIARGRQARMGCFRLRREKEKRVQQAKKMQSDRMLKAVIKIQSHARRRAAITYTQARRAMLAKELDGDRGGSPTNEGRGDRAESSRKGAERDRASRRKRTADSHGNATERKRTGAAHQEAALAAFEGGSMLVTEPDPAQHRKSLHSMGPSPRHNGKKLTQKKFTRASSVTSEKPARTGALAR